MRLLRRITDPNIFRVYAATFTLGLAYGMAISLIAVFLDERGFGKQAIGSLAAWFAAGIVALSLPMGALIRRFSAKAVLTVSLAGYAITVTLFPLLNSYSALAAVRFFDGAFSVGVWVAAETILLARSGENDKALVTSLYAIAIAVGYIVGPAAARALVVVAPLSFGFFVSGVMALGAALYVGMRLEREPPGSHSPHADETTEPAAPVGRILWRIKTSCFATFAYGYFQASVVLFLPLYLMGEKGAEKEQTIVIPAFFAAGMLSFSTYAGRLGDRFGHLLVMTILGSVGSITVLSFVFLDAYTLMCAAVFIGGATLASISPVSLALQGIVSEPRDYSRATAIYNAFYALGMLIGPPISSRIFAGLGGAPMLYHLAGLWFAFVLFAVAFQRDDPAWLRRREPALLPLNTPRAPSQSD